MSNRIVGNVVIIDSQNQPVTMSLKVESIHLFMTDTSDGELELYIGTDTSNVVARLNQQNPHISLGGVHLDGQIVPKVLTNGTGFIYLV